MSKNARDKRPYVKPVTRIELSETNIKLRWIAIALLLAIAVVAIGYGFASALSTEPGWQEVRATSSEIHYSGDFTLMYEFGQDGISPTAEYKLVSDMYSGLTEDAYRIFSPDAQIEDFPNLYYLNRHPNETVQVAHELYKALELVAEYESRYPFLAPVQAVYDPVFLAQTDVEAALSDPAMNPEQGSRARETAAYAADPAMVSVEVFGSDEVRLNVSGEYLAYAQENGIETFLDLGWMRNAFIVDCMADALAASGYTNGYLASYDGFTRNLDDRGNSYSFNLFDRQENTVLMPALLDYSGPMSIVFLRDYPLSDQDRWHYYSYENGHITTAFLDPADGVSKSAVDSLGGYSADLGCAEILLLLAPAFTADSLNTEALSGLASSGIDTLWYEGSTLYHSQADAALTILPDSGGEGYTMDQAK